MIKTTLLAAALLGATIASFAQSSLPKGHVFHAVLTTDCVMPSDKPLQVEFIIDQDVTANGAKIIAAGGVKVFGQVADFDGDTGTIFIGATKLRLPNGEERPCSAVAIWPETWRAGVKGQIVEASVFNRVFFGRKDSVHLLKGTPVLLQLQAPLDLPSPAKH